METEYVSAEQLRSVTGTFPEYFYRYMKLVGEGNIIENLREQKDEVISFLNSIDEDKWLYRYAEGKWTLKEVVQHVSDAERVFGYRALAFARKDPASLPSFDENSYAANSDANKRNANELVAEFEAVRRSSILLFNSFSAETMMNTGIASGKEISVMALAYISVGHVAHHAKIISEKYLAE